MADKTPIESSYAVLEGCEVLCLTGDLIACPLTLTDQKQCKARKQYEAGLEKGRQGVIKEIERERFETPQHIAESGREPVIICLTEGDLQALKESKDV